MSNDHTVPRMYLRRFAEQRRDEWFVRARQVDDLENHFHRTSARSPGSQTSTGNGSRSSCATSKAAPHWSSEHCSTPEKERCRRTGR